ncbi:MarR family winged helix-turn-helix transcriptional regulator [Microlunatus sp. Y2014]|uniref:MarR family winged helix-turn-helix transcriptional regulator n=1 Tax=Microlunatus sp. Y2014 TaxID=3418488 RepID=UPI003DA716AC
MTDLRTDAALASALRPVVLRLARRLRQMRSDDHGLSPSQLQPLGWLYREGPMVIGELAAREHIRPPSMTRTVNALEAAGLVSREVQPTDRRQCMVSLTEAGHEMVTADRRRRDAWLAKRMAELSAEERAILRKAVPILEKVNH